MKRLALHPSVRRWSLAAVVVYIVLVGAMYGFQRSLLYFPDTARTPPVTAGLPQAQEVRLRTPDGETLIAWHVKPHSHHPVVLYFQGNGGALRDRAARFRKLVSDGTGLVAVSYRGYGGSTGSPTETGLITDALTAYKFAAARYPARRLVAFGESLGTGVAVALAAERPLGGLILMAPFTSVADVAAADYPFLPVRWLLKDTFHSDRRIGSVKVPLLVLHGGRDRVVSIRFGERLFALAHKPKRFVRFPRGGHEDLDEYGAMDAVHEFLAGIH